ncbi:VWA domain-containing protein [Nocardia shimofusensis]|uniref:VWA domain-containing protein n=1 Tax=Nocardia shimofusensis TaxID=228596 RepID=UPI0008295F10|nr:VWA domain-containing protein [Nocardia shimofusensis]
MRYRLTVVLIAVSAVLGGLLSGCGEDSKSGPIGEYDEDPTVLNIVAGSEHTVVFEEIVRPWCRDQGLTCTMTALGSVDQARLLEAGEAPYDAFWFASSVFQQLGDTGHRLQQVRPMFSTPLVFAGRRAELDALGFLDREVGIEEILAAVEAQRTTAWMTNPTQSNSGATVLLGFLNYFAGNGPGEPLTRAQLESEPVRAGITRFARAFARTPPSTGLLMDECLATPQHCQTMFTYEDLVIERNRELVAAGEEPWHVVYPRGVLAISDAPLGFLPHDDRPEKAANFGKLQDFLLSAETQQRLTALGRRPVTSIGLSLPDAPPEVFDTSWGVRPTLSGQPVTFPVAEVIDAALENYRTVYRTPTDLVYCIDSSGSMAGNGGWAGVQRAADLLFDPVRSEQYLLRPGPRDRTAVLMFDQQSTGPLWADGDGEQALAAVRTAVRDRRPSGETGIYRCLDTAANLLAAPGLVGAEEPVRKKLVILMTDGEDTVGGGLDDIAAAGIPVVAVGFGSEVREGTLRRIAERTGGSYLTTDDLVAALRQATGYR